MILDDMLTQYLTASKAVAYFNYSYKIKLSCIYLSPVFTSLDEVRFYE